MDTSIYHIVSKSTLPTQEKYINITENGTVEVVPDEGYSLSKVTVIPQVYEGGRDSRVKELFEGSITNYIDEEITRIKTYCFAYCSELTSVDCPNVTSVDNHAFDKAYSLVNVNLPKVADGGIGTSYVFRDCVSLKNIELPKIKSLGSYYFSGCISLTNVYIPKVTFINKQVFYGCASLTSIEIPTLGGNSTVYCDETFFNCTSLRYALINCIRNIGSKCFGNCTSLVYVDSLSANTLSSNAFLSCTSLTALILRKSDACCSMSNISAFNSTPFSSTGTGGICLVPSNLIESYQTATNWSTLYTAGTCLFWPLEEYTLDGTTTGEINWDKLDTDREGVFSTE